MKKPALLLLPSPLFETKNPENYLPAAVFSAMETIDGLIAESEGQARRYLSYFNTKKKPHLMPVALLNKHTKEEDFSFLLQPIAEGERWGLISDGGLPCVADPGAALVSFAKKRGVEVQALPGPSSLFLALMLSGLCGQRFCFHGYLPKEGPAAEEKIKELSAISKMREETEIFIETPYRNQRLFESFLKALSNDARLSIAWDLCSREQGSHTHMVKTWKKMPPPSLEKRNCVFLFQA